MPTKADLLAELALYEDAREKILRGQTVSIGGQTITRASLAEVQGHINRLRFAIDQKDGKGAKVIRFRRPT